MAYKIFKFFFESSLDNKPKRVENNKTVRGKYLFSQKSETAYWPFYDYIWHENKKEPFIHP